MWTELSLCVRNFPSPPFFFCRSSEFSSSWFFCCVLKHVCGVATVVPCDTHHSLYIFIHSFHSSQRDQLDAADRSRQALMCSKQWDIMAPICSFYWNTNEENIEERCHFRYRSHWHSDQASKRNTGISSISVFQLVCQLINTTRCLPLSQLSDQCSSLHPLLFLWTVAKPLSVRASSSHVGALGKITPCPPTTQLGDSSHLKHHNSSIRKK